MKAPRRKALGVDTLAGRLARSLIVWVGGVWLACVLGVVWYIGSEIDYNFDSELVEVSHRMFDIALDHLDGAAPQAGDGGAPAAGAPAASPLLIAAPAAFAESAVPFQIIDNAARVLARSAGTPATLFDVPLAPGFADAGGWRVYTLHHPTRPLLLQVADPLAERQAAVNRTLLGLIVPLSAVLPLLALLLRRIARSELRVLGTLSQEVALRDGRLLHPIALPGLPRELQSVEDHVNRLLERLALALDVERALATNAAHELRTPLAAARLRLQTALDHGLQRGEVEAALAALHTLAQRTEKLLQLSRAESGAPLARERVDLVQLATTVAEEFWQDPRAIDRLDLLTPEDGSAPVALGDVDGLAIALRNLVENALRYGGSGPVEIRVARAGSVCRLSVRDHGPGVDPTLLHTLRERHVRHSAQRAGYGLGLSIVNTIAHKHGAELLLASPPPGAAHGFEATLVLQSAAPNHS